MQHEPQNPGEDPREDPTNRMPEEANAVEENLNLIKVINNNSVIINTLAYDQFVAPRNQTEEWI